MTIREIRRLGNQFESHWDRGYVKTKLRTDPLYAAVWNHLRGSELPLLDLGCGLGLLAFYLRTRGFTGDIHGVDYDERKIRSAHSVAAKHYDRICFDCGDATTLHKDFSGNVTILDVMQFLPETKQQKLLSNISGLVADGGKLIIRSGLRENNWRFKITHAGDLIARATRWMKAAPTYYPTKEFFQDTLQQLGLIPNIVPLWGKTPFNNYLITAKRS